MSRQRKLEVVIAGDSKGLNKAFGETESRASKWSGAIGKAALAAVAAIATVAIGVGVTSVKAFADFDQAMTRSLSIMGDVSNELRGEMSDAAREVAKTTTFSATEAAESYYFLASAGMDAEAQIAALPQVAKFAQAGMFDMATATDLATDAQSALGLASDDAATNLAGLERVTDVFTRASQLANATTEQFASSITTKAGTALAGLNKDMEEGVAVLGVFADQGIKGDRAGTLLANTLEGLTSNARRNAEEFAALGVEVWDADGNMRNMADIVGGLEQGLAGMTTEQRNAALASLGFTKQATEGMLALVGNSEAIREYEQELRGAGGTVDEVAAKQLETFLAQLGLLKDNLLDVALSIGETLMPHVMRLVEGLQEHMPTIQAFAEKALKVIGEVINNVVVPALAVLAAWWQENGPAIVATAVALWDGIRDAFGRIVGVVKTVIGWFERSRDDIGQSTDETRAWLGDVWEQISGIISGAVELITGIIEVGAGVISFIWEHAGDNLLAIASVIWDTIRSVISGVLKVIQGLIDTVLGVITGDWSRAWQGIKSIFSGVWEAIWGIVSGAVKILGETIKGGLSLIWGHWSGAWEQVRDWASDKLIEMAATVHGKLREVVTFFRELPGRILTALGDLGRLLLSVGTDLVRGIWDGIRSMGGWIAEKVTGFVTDVIPGPIKKVLKIGSPSRLLADEVGVPAAQGIAEGMLSERGRLEATSRDVAEHLVDGVSGLPDELGRLGDDTAAALTGELRDQLPVWDASWGALADVAAGHIARMVDDLRRYAEERDDLLEISTPDSPDDDDRRRRPGDGPSAEQTLRQINRKLDQLGELRQINRKLDHLDELDELSEQTRMLRRLSVSGRGDMHDSEAVAVAEAGH